MSEAVVNPVDPREKVAGGACAEEMEMRSESQTQTRQAEEMNSNRWKPRRIRKWKSPLAMVVFFITGLAMSIGHCVFYPRLDGVVVGNSSNQERNIRCSICIPDFTDLIEGTEPFSVGIALTAAVWLSYTQWLWRSVGKVEVTVNALNAAFGADTSVFSLLNIEMLRKFRIGSVMALFAWCLILPPFFTPATLFIYPSTSVVEVEQLVPYLAIADNSTGHRFAYSPPYSGAIKIKSADDGSRIFNGPRTILTLISTATASLGQILPIRAPYHNDSAYSVQFVSPVVRCDTANSSVVTRIDGFLRDEMANPFGTAKETINAYYAFVPAFNATGGLIALSKPRLQAPSNATNQLWITFLRYIIDSTGNRTQERRYQVCQLYNATYDLNFKWERNFQSVTGSYRLLKEVDFPDDKPDLVSDMSRHAYSAFMWAITDQLVGTFGWFVGSNQSDIHQPPEFGLIDTAISRTSLLGSSDLDVFFDLDKNKGWDGSTNDTQLSDQRLQDKALAKNKTLDVLIEELSFNTTVSLLHNELLA
ncbi:hypothetical protein GP486_002336 [Trichoglossum hirsutum]|uniref:Uncharacterized protein n=1 Tax=Trichoglossum hirsutum TaxID=265104 RepID=A0A9P8RS79_9PEZI|nr:hypothetical protein GP486_002336 [Trichoglossum hirsutum]